MPSLFPLSQVLLPALNASTSLQVGDPLPELSLKDQHDQPRPQATRYLLFSADKEGSNLVDAVLEGQTGESLETAGLSYVADISGMPAMVTKLFALPKLRKCPYPVLLGRAAEDTMTLPRQAGKVTVIELDGGRVAAIEFMDDAGSARTRLGLSS